MSPGRIGFGLRCLFRVPRRDASPLWRGTDWFEPCALLVLSVFTMGAVVVAILLGQFELSNRMAQVHAEQDARHVVSAPVVARADRDNGAHSVAVRLGQGEQERFAIVDVSAAGASKPEVPVWVDQQGQVSAPPMDRGEALEAAGITGVLVLVGFSIVGGGGYATARWLVQRRRLSAWEAEWARVEPRWRGQPN